MPHIACLLLYPQFIWAFVKVLQRYELYACSVCLTADTFAIDGKHLTTDRFPRKVFLHPLSPPLSHLLQGQGTNLANCSCQAFGIVVYPEPAPVCLQANPRSALAGDHRHSVS